MTKKKRAKGKGNFGAFVAAVENAFPRSKISTKTLRLIWRTPSLRVLFIRLLMLAGFSRKSNPSKRKPKSKTKKTKKGKRTKKSKKRKKKKSGSKGKVRVSFIAKSGPNKGKRISFLAK